MSEYRYMRPIEAYSARKSLTGERAARAYWVHSDRREREATDASAGQYSSAFTALETVVPGKHAFRLVFKDGTYEELCSYDTVCVAPRRCDTIGCNASATHLLSWVDEFERTVNEKVCEPCGQGYASRPLLKATLAPLEG